MMQLETKWVEYGAEPFTGYLCHPRGAQRIPGVLVLQEAWGVDAHIQDVAQRYAKAGYAAFAPDLFAKGGKRSPALAAERLLEVRGLLDANPTAFADQSARDAALAKLPPDLATRIRESLGAMMGLVMNLAGLLPAVVAAAQWLRADCPVTRGRKVGSVGYCMGGGMSALLATADPDLAVAVIYYGMSPPLDAVPRITCPVLGLYGALDDRVNQQVPSFAEAMKTHGKRFEAVTYPGARHAFSNDERPSYDPEASRDAFARTLELFRVALA
jgi:carboxymethylenebutenolidase